MHTRFPTEKSPRPWRARLRRGAHFARRLMGAPSRRESRLVAPISPALPPSAQTSDPHAPSLLHGQQTAARRFGFFVANSFTAASIVLGMVAIVVAMHGSVQWAAIALLGCVVCDGLDGAFARRFGVVTPFGAQMDSLADMCSFGIATPVVAYAWLVGAISPAVVVPVCALMAVCAAIRLARFNISPKDSSYFTGVPTTMAAGIVVLAALFMPEPAQIVAAAIGAGAVALLSLLMVSAFPYIKFGQLRRVPLWLWIVPLGVAVINPLAGLGTIVGGYLASGPLMRMRRH